MKDPKEIADKYFERYAQLADTSTRIMLIALLVIITNWLFVVEYNFARFNAAKQKFNERFEAIESRFVQLRQMSPTDSVEARKIAARKDSLTEEKKELAKEKNSYIEKISEIRDVPTLIKFVFFISDNLEKGALILNIVLFIFLFYFLFIRRICLKYLVKAIRIYQVEPNLQINQYRDFNLSSPFWLAPLPGIRYKDVEPASLKTILGWTFSHGFWKTIIIISLSFIILVQLRLTYISCMVNGSFSWFLCASSVTLTLLTALVVFYWLRPIQVEDNFNYERNPNPFTRKDFIVIGSMGVLSLAAYKFAPLLPDLFRKKVPRYRVKRKLPDFSIPDMKNMLVLNKKSNIVYYLNSYGKSVCFDSFSTNYDFEQFKKHIEPFNTIDKLQPGYKKPRLRLRHSGWHAENFALEKIRVKDFKAATDILLYAIRQNVENHSPAYRLHDLLAIICTRHNTAVPPGTWNRLVDLSNSINDEKLIRRVTKWTDKKWQSKILDQKEGVTFAGVLI